MRRIDKIIIHSSATPPSMDIGRDEIYKWHTDLKPQGRGWSDIGYHFVVRRNGIIEIGRPIGNIGAHTRGHNRNSIGVCWVGGYNNIVDKYPEDNRTDEQKESMLRLNKALFLVLEDLKEVLGHGDLANTKCPSFDAKEEFKGN